MIDKDDWRLQNQQAYLSGAVLVWRLWSPPKGHTDWDHDHCEFCWAKFMVEDYPEVLPEGYTTLDEYRWICSGCCEDFKEMFEWRVVRALD